ncbi:hypothetical protein ACFV00_00800, partial [Streptomyces californicus]
PRPRPADRGGGISSFVWRSQGPSFFLCTFTGQVDEARGGVPGDVYHWVHDGAYPSPRPWRTAHAAAA